MKKDRFTRDTLRFPQRDFDMVKEGVISLGIIGVLIVGASAIFGAPYRPAVTNQQIALGSPLIIEQTAIGDLSGTGSIASYGPPYNHGWHGQAQSIQSIMGFSPQTWWGTPYHWNTAQNDIMAPLQMLATASSNNKLSQALQQYQNASYAQQQKWDTNYSNALNKATVSKGAVVTPFGNYGPVALMMNSELQLAKSGLLSGALDRQTNGGVYRYDVSGDLLFLQGTTLHNIANSINMQGNQWGINHDETALPGPWWLTPYTFLYQIPPYSTSASGDEMAAYTIGILFTLLVLVPWVPGLNKLPKVLPVHRLIWRDWYRDLTKQNACANCPLRDSCSQEFRGKKGGVLAGELPNCYQSRNGNA